MKSIQEYRDSIADLTDEAEAIHNIATDEKRDFTDDENKRFDAIMDAEKGELVAIQKELKAAEKRDAEIKRLAASRSALSVPAPTSVAALALQASQQNGQEPQPRLITPGKLRAFTGPDAARDAYDSGMWLRALVAQKKGSRDENAENIIAKRGWNIQAVQTEGTGTAGGNIVPDPLSSAIIDVRQVVSVMRSLARVVPMTSDTLDVPKRTAGLTVYYPGEASAITLSDKTWGKVSLTAVKRATLTKVSQELTEDAVIGVMDDIASEAGHALALKEDNEFVNGDGTATYGGETGILTALGSAGKFTSASGNDTWPELTLADFSATMALLPAKFWDDPSWVCSPAFYHTVMVKLLAAAGGNTMASIESGGAQRPVFLGYPVFFTDQMATATAASTVSALFGTFRQAVLVGDRTGVRIGISDQYAWDEDVLTLRSTTRYDINWHEAGDGSDAGAIVGLSTSS